MRSLARSISIALSAFSALVCFADPSAAQSSAAASPPLPATDSIFKRARRLVSDGNGPAGRAIVDSMLRASSEGAPSYGDALFWRGALAETAAAAERDYRRVVVEYPLSPYVDDALLSLAELEQARGDREAAFQHLQRFVREHPASPARARAGLAAARLAFEQRDMTHGCSMIADARTSVGTSDVELRNQIDYYGGRCPTTTTVNTASVPAATPPTSSKAALPTASQMGRASTPAPTASAPASRSAVAAQSAKPSQSTTSVTTSAESTASTPLAMVAETPKQPAETQPVEKASIEKESARKEPVEKKPVEKAPARTEPAEKKSAEKAPAAPEAAATKEHARPKAPSAPRGIWTIQLAAYNTRPDAERLVKKLAGRGVQARVSGDEKPFRVRLDYYPTRQAAAAAVAELKQRGIIGFVTDEPRPSGATSP